MPEVVPQGTVSTANRMLNALRQLGIERIFGIVGREADSILFDECPDIEFVLTRHEANAGFMAVAMCRFTGRPQVCFSTLGPGSTNLATPLATAMLDRYPLVCIAAQIETRERAYNHAHQCVDGVAINAAVTKFSYELAAEDDIADVLQRAFAVATATPPGPVFISIPNDILKQPATVSPGQFSPAAAGGPAAGVDRTSDQLARAADLLDGAEQPMLVIGDAALRRECAPHIVSVARRCGIPVVTSYSAKGVLPAEDVLSYGPITPHMDAVLEYPALAEIFAPVDALLLVGYDIAEHLLPSVWSIGRPKTVIRLADHENPTPEHLQPNLDIVVGSLRDGFARLGEQLARHAHCHSVAGVQARMAEMAANRIVPGDALLPEQVITVLNSHYPDYILCNDVGYHRHVSALFYRANRPLDFVTSSGLSSFGTGLPLGIGSKLANPDREVVVVAGDVGFHSSSAELETAARLGLKLTVVVYQNSKAGLIERYQQLGHGRINPEVLRYRTVDFPALARANGCHGIAAETIDQFEAALKEADNVAGPTVIEVPIDYPNNYINAYTKNFHES